MSYSLKHLPILARDDRDGFHQSAKNKPYHHEYHPQPKVDIRAYEANIDHVQWAHINAIDSRSERAARRSFIIYLCFRVLIFF
jgi:hypothetical protein